MDWTRLKISCVKIELVQDIQLFFFRFFFLSYVNWVQLHRKTLKKIFLLALNAFFFEKFEKSEFLTFFKKSSKWSFLWNMTSISERALKITGLWGFWDFQVGFLTTILKNQNFSFFFLKNAISLEKEFFQKKTTHFL